MLILVPVSSMDLVKDIPPISLIIMGAPGSLFLIGMEFIIIELTVSLSWIPLVHIPLRNLAYDGICLMVSTKGMVMVTFLKASSRWSSDSLVLNFGRLSA